MMVSILEFVLWETHFMKDLMQEKSCFSTLLKPKLLFKYLKLIDDIILNYFCLPQLTSSCMVNPLTSMLHRRKEVRYSETC
jgi:hypothetical protein